MNKKFIFQQIIADFFEKPLDHVRARAHQIPTDAPKIISLLGPRRSGKTYVAYEIIKQLRINIPRNRIVYINFEDDRLFPLQLSDMDDLLQAYYEQFPENKDRCVWFFFDEIQEVPNWEKFVRRVFDQENCRIYLTGSSSKLLSRELSTALRGRSIPFEIFPLSFQEFLDFHQVEVNQYSSKGQALLIHHVRKYMHRGGFPELFFLAEELHNRVINEYIDLMLYRDLSERFSIKQPHLMKYLLKHLVINMAKPISINKLYNDIKSQNYKAGKNTIYDYISYLEEAFIVFRVDLWTSSIRKQVVNPSKIYIIDPAVKYAMSIQQDTGRVFENMIFLELRRRGIHPHYVQHKREVDFYWEGGRLINACFDYRESATREREINGLLEAMDMMGVSEAELINWDQRDILTFGDKRIYVKAGWEFMLEK